MTDLTDKEQQAVRATLRFLRFRMGARALAEVVHLAPDSLKKIINGRRNVQAGLAVRVARLVGAKIDDVLAGRYLLPNVCPHCGHVREDFVDEETRVEDAGLNGV